MPILFTTKHTKDMKMVMALFTAIEEKIYPEGGIRLSG